MWLLHKIAEERLAEASRNGELDDLPGAGKPLDLDDDVLVPVELRTAYRLLKNAGFVPEEVRLRREIQDVEELLARVDSGEERDAAWRRLNHLVSRLNASCGNGALLTEQRYFERLRDKLTEKDEDYDR